MTIVKIAIIALLILIGSGCATTAHIDLLECTYPNDLATITKEQQNSIEKDTWLKLQQRQSQIKAFAEKQCKKIQQHNERFN